MNASTKRELLERLLRSRAAAGVSDHPLSYNQRSLWFTYCLAPDSAAYNATCAFRVGSPLDVAALRRAFDGLMARHAVLRTTYAPAEPIQHVHERMPVDFEEADAADWSDAMLRERLVDEARRPFDLRKGPVWRVRLFKRAGGEHALLIVFHHIAYDLWSVTTLFNELRALYSFAGTADDLPPSHKASADHRSLGEGRQTLAYQYADFVRWQAEMLAADGDQLWSYWKNELEGELPLLRLPCDFERPPVQSYNGAMHRHELPRALADAVGALARAEESTLFIVLLAAFQLLLHRHSGDDDILVGSPVAGRSRAEFDHVVGYFLNALPLRARFGGNPSFRALLRQVRQTVHGALEHQDFPVELIVERLKPARSAGHAPLFQSMFVLSRAHRLETPAATDAGGPTATLRLEQIPLDLPASQFDFSLEVDQWNGGLLTRWEYNTDLFRQTTVAEWAAQFERLLAAVVADPDRRVRDVPLVARAYVAPRTVAEETVAATFADVFGLEQVGVHDSLFTLGGDLTKASQVRLRLSEIADVDIDLAAIFQAPTVEAVAARLEEILLEQIKS